jgi:hypothetical protein
MMMYELILFHILNRKLRSEKMADQLDQSSNQHPISFPSQIKVTFFFSQAAGQLQEQCSLKKTSRAV